MTGTASFTSCTDVLGALESVRVVPVLRSSSRASAIEEGTTFIAGGMPVVEVTFSIPETTAVIRELSSVAGSIVGAGTVLTRQNAVDAVAAGARFLVAPVNPYWLIPLAAELGVLVIPGAATPSELFAAVDTGAQMVKVFPIARLGGAAYIKDLLAPMPHLPLMATGGVNLSSAQELLEAGCVAVGMGSILRDEGLGDDPLARVRSAVKYLARGGAGHEAASVGSP